MEVSSGYRPERYERENFEKMHADDGEGHAIARGSGRNSKLSLQDQLLLTLLRLRLGRMEKELVYQFGIDEATVSRIMKTWLNFMYQCIFRPSAFVARALQHDERTTDVHTRTQRSLIVAPNTSIA